MTKTLTQRRRIRVDGGRHVLREGLLGLVLATGVVTPALATDSGSTAWEDESGAHIALTWLNPVKVESSFDGRDLILRFDHPVEDSDPEGLVKALPNWLEWVNSGYDSFSIRANRDVVWHVVVTKDNVVNIDLIPATAKRAGQADLRIGLLRARLLGETGHYTEARATLADLATRNPDNTEITVAQSALEAQADRSSAASDLLQQGLTRHPSDPALAAARRDLLADDGPAVTLTHEYTHVRNAETYRSTLLEVAPVTLATGLTVGLSGEARSLSTSGLVTPDGNQQPFYGREQRGSLWFDQDLTDSLRAGLTVVGSTRTLGGGGQVRWKVGTGQFNAAAIYHQPYWETPEGVAKGGVVDTALVGYSGIPSEWLSFSLQLRANRYAEDKDHFVGTSGGALFDVRVLPFASIPQLAMIYELDAEYMAHKANRFDSDGTPVQALGLQSREAHRAGVEWTENDFLLRDFDATLSGGYIWDRLQAHGAYYGLTAGYRIIPSLRLEAYAEREHVSTLDKPGVTTRVGGDVRVRF